MMTAGDEMQIHYTTQSGSVYRCSTHASGDVWHKQSVTGEQIELAGAMHISRRRLQALITDYPTSALDQTACFGEGVAREFFDDARRQRAVQVPETEESTIFFLVDRGLGQYGIGHSSRIVNVELDLDTDTLKTATKAS